ncbi:TonB-dependent receptor plug domain-containing protein [Bergeyella porcorum]|uniref:TonB-dependent receptor plug domain-containing protein n=1 Tax=Bergeyella porcorum TaxID=1735111 RepID=UPI0035E71031
MKLIGLCLMSTVCVVNVYAQNVRLKASRDSLERSIEEVVITGQYGISTIKKSLHKVEVITKEDIKKMSQNSVAEVLNQNLNILIIPERNSGNSKANIMGLGANYTKILVDNVPLIGDEGLGSNIDLTKINLDNVERIEIVKGSMGVEFGNNAMAGIINIITKNSDKKKWDIRGFVQEETVNNEYDWIDYGKGKHIQSLGISHNINENWFVNLSFNRTDFQGFWGEQKGKNYFEQDNKRGYEWQPKEQVNSALSLRYNRGNTKWFYKLDFLSEDVNYYNPLVQLLSLGGGNRTYISNDRNYFTTRWLNHMGISTQIFEKTRLNIDLSHQKQTRNSQDVRFDIPARNILLTGDETTYYQSETLYSRGNISNFIRKDNTDVQLGYEVDYTKGFSNWAAGSYNQSDIRRSVFSGGIFASGEFQLLPQWFIRPGIRYNFSDTFKAKPTYSLVLKTLLNEKSEVRAIIGTSNRNPNFEELFTYFVDSNHDIRGNENLKPENAYSGSILYTISGQNNAGIRWSFDANTMYLQIRDKIHSAVVNNAPLQFRFINVDAFESWVTSVSGKLNTHQWSIRAGASIMGRSQEIYEILKDQYRFSAEWNASAHYTIPQTQTSFAVYYKGVGSNYDIMEDQSLGVTQYILTKRKGFSLLDASVSQSFFKERFSLTMGVRNLLDVTNVRNTTSTGGAHGTGENAQMLFYGRSYFGRINFNF